MQVEIKNFQSIEDAKLSFNSGEIVHLAGQSNNGKTAVLRAIKALVVNPNGSGHYIQHGKNKAEVTISNNNETLTWERTKSTVNYKHNGEVYAKAARQSAQDFCDLGFLVDNKGNFMNLSDEWSTLFPFYMSDTQLFELFEDLFNITDTKKIIDSMKSDETNCNKEKIIAQDKLNSIKTKYETFSNISGQIDVAKLEMIKQVLTKKSKELTKLKEDYKTYVDMNSISKLEVPSERFKTDKLTEMGKHIYELHKCLKSFVELPQIPQTKKFDLDIKQVSDLKRAEIEYQQQKTNEKSLEIQKMNLESTLKELQEQWNSIDTCPLCNQEWKH